MIRRRPIGKTNSICDGECAPEKGVHGLIWGFPVDFRALFGYEGQTNDLKLVSTGDGGLEELCDELNSGKIMYAFARIEDPTTSLTKFLLINWQVSN